LVEVGQLVSSSNNMTVLKRKPPKESAFIEKRHSHETLTALEFIFFQIETSHNGLIRFSGREKLADSRGEPGQPCLLTCTDHARLLSDQAAA
jgi:hypothetical protein